MVMDSRPSARRRVNGVHHVSSGQYASIARDKRFLQLKAKFTRLAIVLVTLFLGWYFLYVLLSAFARGFMARQVAGNINVALLFGVLQFVSTFVLAWCYARYARRVLDPLAAQIRTETDVGLTARRLPPTRLRPELGPGPRPTPTDMGNPASSAGLGETVAPGRPGGLGRPGGRGRPVSLGKPGALRRPGEAR